MIRWITLLGLLIISAGFIGIGEHAPAIEEIAKLVYFAVTILLVISLIIRDVQRKQVE